MAQDRDTEVAGIKASMEDMYWWEDDFYSGRLVDLPDNSKDVDTLNFGFSLPHQSDHSDESLGSSASADIPVQGFVLSRVPSLVNLCMNEVMSSSDDTKPIHVPPGLGPLLRRQQERKRLQRIQLTWLLNELINRDKTIEDHLRPCVNHSSKLPDTGFFRGCRPAWETDLNARQYLYCGYTFGMYSDESCWYLPVAVEGRETSDWCIAALAHTIQMMLPHRLPLRKSEPHTGRTQSEKEAVEVALEATIKRVSCALARVCPKLVKYCFEPAVAYVWWSRGDMSKAKEIFLRIAERMPSDLESDPSQMSEGEDEVQSTSEGKWILQKALYLNEVARAHLYFGQPEPAVTYYQQAADQCSTHIPALAVDCSMQSLMLMATAFDEGLMCNALAVRAADSWSTAVVQPECHPNIVQMAAESFLHCHSGYPATHGDCSVGQNTAWLLEAKHLLRGLAARAPQVNLHLSLVEAMLGYFMEAEESYMNYVQQYASHSQALAQRIPGAVSVFIGPDIKSHPWWVFSEWQSHTNKSGKQGFMNPKHLRTLPLVWRRRFRFCGCDIRRIHDEYMYQDIWNTLYWPVTDSQVENLCLHLNEDGFLTGRLIQNLPPLRPLLLDPFTGSICVPDQYHEEEALPWSNCKSGFGSNDVTEFDLTFDTSIPTSVKIYSSDVGNVVSLLTWNDKMVAERGTVQSKLLELEEVVVTHATLLYFSCEGSSHKLNLVEAIIAEKKETILEQLRNEGYCNDPKVMEDALDFLDFCVVKSKKMQFDFLKAALDGDSRERLTLIDIKRKLGKTPGRCVSSIQLTPKQQKNLLRSIQEYGPRELETHSIVLMRVTLVGRSTAVLAFYTAASTTHVYDTGEIDTLVFVDCTSPETFNKPVIHCPDQPNATWCLPSQDNHMDKSAKIFVAVEKSFKPRLVIFDTKGIVVQSHSVWDCQTFVVVASSLEILDNDPEHTDMVLHTNKIKSRLRLISTNGTMQFQTKPLGTIEQFILVESMVFVSLRDRILILDSATLEPIETRYRENGHSTDQPSCPSGKSGVLLTGERSFLKALSVNSLSVTPQFGKGDKCIQVILGVANHVFVLQRAKHTDQVSAKSTTKCPSAPVTILAKIMVPGVPTEACHLNQIDGFVVTVSVFESSELPLYRENLYWFGMDGCIRGIHPFIGLGPHCLFAAEFKQVLTKVEEAQELKLGKNGRSSVSGKDDKQWHIFFADGLGALCCIKLPNDF